MFGHGIQIGDSRSLIKLFDSRGNHMSLELSLGRVVGVVTEGKDLGARSVVLHDEAKVLQHRVGMLEQGIVVGPAPHSLACTPNHISYNILLFF